MHDSSTFELIEEKAEIRRSHRLILRLGRDQIGPPDAASESALLAIRDLDRLERIAAAAPRSKTWPDLVAVP